MEIPNKLRRFDYVYPRQNTTRMPILIAILVFSSAFVIDFADTRYTMAVGDRDANRAALWSIVMYSMGAVGWIAIVQVSMWCMVPEALGFYCGTRYALRK